MDMQTYGDWNFEPLQAVIDQINTVLSFIIPGLSIQIYKHNPQYIESDNIAIPVELILVRDGRKIALRNESEGIKKIISILSTIISMYNQPDICLVIDELDSGVFTTTNPENRYIRMEGVKSNNNLRDFYLRTIMLGGQKEVLYEETNSPEIRYSLRKAGKIL